jgi:hypothetical protein
MPAKDKIVFMRIYEEFKTAGDAIKAKRNLIKFIIIRLSAFTLRVMSNSAEASLSIKHCFKRSFKALSQQLNSIYYSLLLIFNS